MVIQMVQWVHLDHRKESACQCWRCKRRRFNLWVGKIPGGGNDNPLQYSCLGNPMDSRAWWAIIHGVAKESDMTEQLKQQQLSQSSKPESRTSSSTYILSLQ